MKNNYVILLAVIISSIILTAGKPVNKRQVTFVTTIDCQKCVEKVTENISFEKGVEDLEVKLEDKTVKITYLAEKTDTLKLGKAIRKLGYEAKAVEDISTPTSKRP